MMNNSLDSSLITKNNFKNILKLKTQTFEAIDECLNRGYIIDDMIKFLDAYSETSFINYYSDYVTEISKLEEYVGDDSINIVDSYVDEFGFDNIDACYMSYYGTFKDERTFAKHLVKEYDDSISSYIVIDWKSTIYNLFGSEDSPYVMINSYVFDR